MNGSIVFWQWAGQSVGLLFMLAFGACVGSFLNVVAYRLPRGMNLISPPSRCPACGTKLTWRENFPLLGYVLLRGRCRHCGARISPQYVLMEALMAALFVGLWVLWGVDERALSDIGVHLGPWRAEWAREGMALMWPMLILVLALVGALVTMTVIDAQTFTIPASIPWFILGLALVVHPLHALFVETRHGGLTASPHEWTIPVPGWPGVGAALGGALGLLIANGLLAVRAIPRSFADFEQWEREAEAAQKETEAADADDPESSEPAGEGLAPVLVRTLLFTGPAIAGMFIGAATLAPGGRATVGVAVGGVIGLVIGAFLRRLAPSGELEDAPIWAHYPHARREMFKEILFLAPVLVLIGVGVYLGYRQGEPWILDEATGDVLSGAEPAALWLRALGGSVLGALAGGGVVWGVRIVGSLAFGREAMGLGDVHLMAAVGAVMGWIDPVLAFFVAPFSGIAWALTTPLLGKLVRLPSVLPYGPHLALATIALIYLRPLFEGLLSLVVRGPVDLP